MFPARWPGTSIVAHEAKHQAHPSQPKYLSRSASLRYKLVRGTPSRHPNLLLASSFRNRRVPYYPLYFPPAITAPTFTHFGGACHLETRPISTPLPSSDFRRSFPLCPSRDEASTCSSWFLVHALLWGCSRNPERDDKNYTSTPSEPQASNGRDHHCPTVQDLSPSFPQSTIACTVQLPGHDKFYT